MQRIHFSIPLGLILLSGCSMTPEQQEALDRRPDPPGSTFLVTQTLGEEGITCKYSNGEIKVVKNIAAGCP